MKNKHQELPETEALFTRRFDQAILDSGSPLLHSQSLTALQVNVGRLCNLSCRHCHVTAAPGRLEIMTPETMEAVLHLARRCPPCTIDITGGAPEMNPHFRTFVAQLRREGFPVQVRTNLTVGFEAGQQDLFDFFHQHQVALVASLPCYLAENVDAQRGSGTYQQSIEAIRQLNRLGYGQPQGLSLSLVYNPGGPFLPPSQEDLEDAYRRELQERYGLSFTRLLTLANMPIGRFLEDLRHENKARGYCQLLEEAFNPETLDGLMCRHQISIDWDGRLFDCDFNLALQLPLNTKEPLTVFSADPEQLLVRRIRTAEHCFGCTAGSGSSCGGSLV
ncbi:MAG: radical SAM protein, partial [Desulfuromonas sp.]